jgi:tRNA threonylcarbamoyladenosine biosynthesis protein TsaE
VSAAVVRLTIGSPEAMRSLGRALGQAARAGDRFLLEGPFGAGKTTLVQGLAEGLNVNGAVSSPSFVIETQYRGRLVLYHIDLYRLDRIEPALLEELEEHLFGDGVSAVEWADRLPDELRADGARVRIHVDGDRREVELTTSEERLAAAAA